MANQKSIATRTVPTSAPSPFQALHDEMDRFMSAFAPPQIGWGAAPALDGALGLRVDVAETDDEIEVKADLPGVDRSDVDVTLDGDVLTLRAEKKASSDREEQDWKVRERAFGSFARSIRVPSGVDPSDVSAAFDDGVLTVRLPKPPGAKPAAKIAVKAG
ncbi:MAG: Hsp20/alpha crystallin family protein [Pseudomonadota bacterium]